MSKNYISREGLDKLKKELKELKTIKRPAVIERIASARELGDLSENAEYHEAREEQGFIEGRVQEIESLMLSAIVVKSNKGADVVSIGSTVHASCEDGRKISYQVVGPSEADPAGGKISNESPLGRAFIGKRVGDEFELEVPGGKIKCKVDKIS
jgi:transcription elongation factor GreA